MSSEPIIFIKVAKKSRSRPKKKNAEKTTNFAFYRKPKKRHFASSFIEPDANGAIPKKFVKAPQNKWSW